MSLFLFYLTLHPLPSFLINILAQDGRLLYPIFLFVFVACSMCNKESILKSICTCLLHCLLYTKSAISKLKLYAYCVQIDMELLLCFHCSNPLNSSACVFIRIVRYSIWPLQVERCSDHKWRWRVTGLFYLYTKYAQNSS